MSVTRDEFDALTARVAHLEELAGVTPPPGEDPLPETWTVRPGDTLSEIADATGTTVGLLVAWNELPDPDLLRVGQVLRLTPPADEEPEPEPSAPQPPPNLRAEVDEAARTVLLTWDAPITVTAP